MGSIETTLEPWGWNEYFAAAFDRLGDDRLVPGRVVLEQPRTLHLVSTIGDVVATTSGRLRHHAVLKSDLPAVGDWVAFRPAGGNRTHATVDAVLPRRSKLSRKVAGLRTDEQVVAANVDRVFLVMGLDSDFSPRRVERYLLMFREAGVDGVVVLNKLDLAEDLPGKLEAMRAVTGEVPVIVVSCKHSQHVDELERFLEPRTTIALVGSSGAGKSTLVNRLLGEDRVATGSVRSRDDQGQHTTRHRELVRLPGGAILVDNPGIRELQPWVGEEAVDATFDDVVVLAADCRFGDCRHEAEPGCAVRAAIASGSLLRTRFESYRALQEQVTALGARQKGLEQKQARRPGPSPNRTHRRKRPK